MAEELKDEKKLTKVDDGYIWSQQFESKLTQEDFDKNKSNLQKNIDYLKKQIKELDIRKLIEKKKKELDKTLAINKEAIKNFDKYVEEQVETIINKVKSEKETMENFIKNFDKIKEITLLEEKKTILDKIKQNKELLNDQEEKLKYYEN